MPVTCSIYSWNQSEKPVFVASFSSQPAAPEVKDLTKVIPELQEYKGTRGRFFGIFDLQGHHPADPIHVILQAKALLGLPSVLDSVILVNAHKHASIAGIIEQINLFTRYQVYILKEGPEEEQAQTITTIAKKNPEVAKLLNEYLNQKPSSKTKALKLIKKLF